MTSPHGIYAFKNAPPMSNDRTVLFSIAAMAAIVYTATLDTVGLDDVAHFPWLPILISV
jgi:hypothetical protein